MPPRNDPSGRVRASSWRGATCRSIRWSTWSSGSPGNQLGADIAPAIATLVEQGTVHILDLVHVRRDADGQVTWSEYDDLEEVADGLRRHRGGGRRVAHGRRHRGDRGSLAPDTSALVIVWEDRWASGFGRAIRAAGGRLVTGRRIAPEVVEAAFADLGDADDEETAS
jgi:hypothetical protein